MNALVSQIGAQVAVGAAVACSIPPQVSAAGGSTLNGTGIDCRAYRSCVLRVESGAVTGAPTTTSVTGLLQHSPDNATWTSYVPPLGKPASITALTGANMVGAVGIDLSGAQQFVRVQSVSSFTGGASPTVAQCAQLIFGGADHKPTVL